MHMSSAPWFKIIYDGNHVELKIKVMHIFYVCQFKKCKYFVNFNDV